MSKKLTQTLLHIIEHLEQHKDNDSNVHDTWLP